MHIQYLRHFAHAHDEIPAFHAAYLVLTFLAAAMLNMGAFGLLIIAHMSLDIVKYREIHGKNWLVTLEATFRESLVDIAVFCVGLVFAVYLHNTIGLVGLSGLLRAEATMLRMLGTVIPKLTILNDFLKMMVHLRHYLQRVHPQLQREWTPLERVCVLSIAVTLGLIAGATSIMNVDPAIVERVLVEELVPWRI